MNETERLLAAVVDMQHYVTHDVDQGKCAACQRWDELQSAAMAAAGRIDALSAELAALRAEIESAHAAQLHAENELSQYMAWYAMAEHQHLHEQRRAERAEQEAAGLRAALEAITRRAPIMGSTGPYREGQLDALEACREIASAALGER